jgi:hypothetical protein
MVSPAENGPQIDHRNPVNGCERACIDATENADLPNELPSPLTAMARALDQKEVAAESPAHKRPRVAAGENEQRTSDSGQPWNYGNGAGNSNRAWSGPRKISGGPKSSF